MAFAALGTGVDMPWAVEMETPGSAKEWERNVQEAWDKLVQRRGGDVWGVLLCVPGIVDEVQGKVLFSPNVHWSEGGGLSCNAGRPDECPGGAGAGNPVAGAGAIGGVAHAEGLSAGGFWPRGWEGRR